MEFIVVEIGQSDLEVGVPLFLGHNKISGEVPWGGRSRAQVPSSVLEGQRGQGLTGTLRP